jgi:hypothetical protein
MVTRPGPGRPATPFTAEEPVGATQNTAAKVGIAVSFMGGSAIPTAIKVPVPILVPVKPPVRKHSRLVEMQLPIPPPQAALPVHPRWA